MSITTPRLLEQFDYIKLLKQEKLINKTVYNEEKAKLVVQQKKINALNDKRRAKREEERLKKVAIEAAKAVRLAEAAAAARKVARAADRKAEAMKRKEKKTIMSNTVLDTIVPNDVENFIYRTLWKGISTQYRSLLFYIIYADKNEDNLTIDVNYENKYPMYRLQFGISDNLYIHPGDRCIALTDTKIPAIRLKQAFRDGFSHCVFQPIMSHITKAIETASTKDSKRKWANRLANMNDLEAIYKNGVPEDTMEEVCKSSGLKITIKNVIGNNVFVFNDKSRKGQLVFTNTRANHIDVGFLSLDDAGIELTEDEMLVKWKYIEANYDFYMIQADLKNKLPYKLYTLDGVWCLKDNEKQYFDEMNKIADIHNCRFNATLYPDVNDFIKVGRLINSWNCDLNEGEATGHIDMPKAYTQFKRCSMYSGFLGIIHQWRSGVFDLDFISKNIGIYRFKVTGGYNEYFDKVGMCAGKEYILPSVEILFYAKHGLEVSINAGVWGSRMDFEFTPSMLEKGKDKVPRYSRWTGLLASEKYTKNYTFKCNQEWASHLKHEIGNDNVYYWNDLNICSVRVPKKNVYTTHHITAFITSYVRIQMLEAMMKFKPDNLVRIVLDGLYFKGDIPSGLEWFSEKKMKPCEFSDKWFIQNTIDIDWTDTVVNGNTLITGQGGAGKTHLILNDKGLNKNKMLFVSPMNLLGNNISEKYKVRSTTIHKLLGKGTLDKKCRPWKEENGDPAVIVIDEITQIEGEWIDEAITMYNKSLFVLLGDINSKGQWFQCRNGTPGKFSSMWKPKNVNIIHIEGDRRSLDKELVDLKINIRNKMCEVFTDGDDAELHLMKSWALNNLNCVDVFDAVSMFKPGDAWIAGTHKTNEILLALGVVSGYYKKGGHVSFDEIEGYTKRGSFTTHSYQGQTIEDKKVFITIGDMFEYSMLYTAVSRVRHFNQLVFVR